MNADTRARYWPYRADIPQRYNDNESIYRARGGLVRLAEDIRGYVADGEVGDVSRFFTFCLIQDQLIKEGLEGELAELGVYKGNTASLLAITAKRTSSNVWLFDTFEGFNQADIKGIDADKAVNQFMDTSLQAVAARLGTQNVRYVQGYFPESTHDIPDDLRFKLVHIDCDLYEPILAGLRYFYPRMVPGGFMVLHDYTSLAWNGAERAIDEFFADKPESVIPMPDGAGSAIIRRMRDPAVDAHWSRPRGLPLGSWVSPGAGGLQRYLTSGWSLVEDWGVWGLGQRHVLTLAACEASQLLEIECSACLPGQVGGQEIAVMQGRRQLASWKFTPGANRAVRTLEIPASAKETELVFLPSSPVSPKDHDAGSSDERVLGMALYRLRRAS